MSAVSAILVAAAALLGALLQYWAGRRRLGLDVETMLREEVRSLREDLNAEVVVREANQAARIRCEAAIMAMRLDLALLKAALKKSGIDLPQGLVELEYGGQLPDGGGA